MLVCHCKRVTDTTIRHAVRCGARTVDEVGALCRAGTGCGGCKPRVRSIAEDEGRDEAVRAQTLPLLDVG